MNWKVPEAVGVPVSAPVEVLRAILKEDYQLEVDQSGLFEFGNSLVGFFELLSEMQIEST